MTAHLAQQLFLVCHGRAGLVPTGEVQQLGRSTRRQVGVEQLAVCGVNGGARRSVGKNNVHSGAHLSRAPTIGSTCSTMDATVLCCTTAGKLLLCKNTTPTAVYNMIPCSHLEVCLRSGSSPFRTPKPSKSLWKYIEPPGTLFRFGARYF